MAKFLRVDDSNYLNLELLERVDTDERVVYIGGVCYENFADDVFKKIMDYVFYAKLV